MNPQINPPKCHARKDSRAALSDALAAHLLCQEFSVWSEEGSRSFKMLEVNRFWPDPGQEMITPTATILDTAGTQHTPTTFGPSVDESSYEMFGENTALWIVGASINEFQIDFWLGHEPEREAVAAALGLIFNPSATYRGLRLDLGDGYFNRVGRYTLTSWQRIDTESSIYPKERRLSVSIQAEADEVVLRRVQPLAIHTVVGVVGPSET